MTTKRNHKPNTSNAKCAKCDVQANAPKGKRHRKCKFAAGTENPGQNRGVWE